MSFELEVVYEDYGIRPIDIGIRIRAAGKNEAIVKSDLAVKVASFELVLYIRDCCYCPALQVI
jgi:hypothetical protein